MSDADFHYSQLIDLFDGCFAKAYNTRLIKGGDEPLYLPANKQVPYHQVIFAHGFYASALHEISHWCIAGKQRRLQEDYGYWYCPDGRDSEQQGQFEQVEIKPQALDWLFCVAAGYPFQVSCDNLDSDIPPDRIAFSRRVHGQVMMYLRDGPPKRAGQFLAALQGYYQTPGLTAECFPWPQADEGG